jgi:hypothetical protein
LRTLLLCFYFYFLWSSIELRDDWIYYYIYFLNDSLVWIVEFILPKLAFILLFYDIILFKLFHDWCKTRSSFSTVLFPLWNVSLLSKYFTVFLKFWQNKRKIIFKELLNFRLVFIINQKLKNILKICKNHIFEAIQKILQSFLIAFTA